MKKLAVLVGGEFREFENAQKSWEFLKDFDYDIFVSTWDMSYEKNDNLNISISEEVTSDRITKYYPNAFINIQRDFDIDSESSYKMLFHWRKLYKLLRSSGQKYDTILLMRPDICLSYKENFSETINNLLDDRIYNLGGLDQLPSPECLYVNDVLFLGKSEIMLKFLSEFPIPINLNKSIHYHLAKFFVNNDIYVDGSMINTVEFFVMRSIHRKFLNESFKKQCELCTEWWCTKKFGNELNEYFKNKL